MTRILVDTSVWIDHLHRGERQLQELLEAGLVVAHPMVIGELALGSIRDRTTVLGLLADLPASPVATDAEVLALIEARGLMGTGLSLVDTHLLASALVAGDVRIWTRDRRLANAATAASAAWLKP